jgi:hypothetical protein
MSSDYRGVPINGCIAGVDLAFDAVKTVLACRAPITQMVEAMRKAAPPHMYPPQEGAK